MLIVRIPEKLELNEHALQIQDTPFCLLQRGIRTATLKGAHSDFLLIGLVAWILIFK